MNEQILVKALQQGYAQALTQLAETCRHLVLNTVLNILQHEPEAEDITPDVFIQVCQKIKSFRGNTKLLTNPALKKNRIVKFC